MNNVKEKIRKLLAKATSQNEHEAQAALLKARELMARYKVSEKEVSDAPSANRKLKRVRYESQHYSTKTRGWFNPLSAVIAENHCCNALINGIISNQKKWVLFIGLDDDPDLCLEIFTYAVKHIEDRVKKERKTINILYPWNDVRKRYARIFENSYAKGFTVGLQQQYEEQFIQPDTETLALAMTIPQEVKDYTKTLKTIDFELDNDTILSDAYSEGKRAGREFNPIKQLSGEVRA